VSVWDWLRFGKAKAGALQAIDETRQMIEQYNKELEEVRVWAERQRQKLRQMEQRNTEIKREAQMAKPHQLFTVSQVANGFIATFPDGTMLVGSTLSDACVAAQAQCTDRAVREDEETDSMEAMKKVWDDEEDEEVDEIAEKVWKKLPTKKAV
jgi:hypothetical protein